MGKSASTHEFFTFIIENFQVEMWKCKPPHWSGLSLKTTRGNVESPFNPTTQILAIHKTNVKSKCGYTPESIIFKDVIEKLHVDMWKYKPPLWLVRGCENVVFHLTPLYIGSTHSNVESPFNHPPPSKCWQPIKKVTCGNVEAHLNSGFFYMLEKLNVEIWMFRPTHWLSRVPLVEIHLTPCSCDDP